MNKNDELYINEDITGGGNSGKTYVVKTLNKLEAKKSQLECDIVELNTEIVILQGHYNNLKEQYDELKDQYNNLKSDIHSDKITDTKDITELQAKVKGTSAIISTVIALVIGVFIHIISSGYISAHMEDKYESKICPDELVEQIVKKLSD